VSQLLTDPEERVDGPFSIGLWPAGARLSDATSVPSPVRLGVGASLRSHAPVLALTLLRDRGDGRDEVLVGVRTKYNATHQHVMSVPTMRVLHEVGRTWSHPLRAAGRAGVLSSDDLRQYDDVRLGVERAVGDLMARKLGKADALEKGEVAFEVEALMAIQGTSFLGQHAGCDVVEDLTMFNAQVRWIAGHDLGGGRTSSYEPLLWIAEDLFGEMARTRDVGVLDADLDAIEVCVRGLCIESTMRVLAAKRDQ
jgi:hypothetical protein